MGWDLTCAGTGSPPFPVLARVSHVFCARDAADAWAMVDRELAAGTVSAGDRVLLRVGADGTEVWTELAVTG